MLCLNSRQNCVESKYQQREERMSEVGRRVRGEWGNHRFTKAEKYCNKNNMQAKNEQERKCACSFSYPNLTALNACRQNWLPLSSPQRLLALWKIEEPVVFQMQTGDLADKAAYLQPWELQHSRAEGALRQSLWFICIPFDGSLQENNSLLLRPLLTSLFL